MERTLPPIPELFTRTWKRFWANIGTLIAISAVLFGVNLLASYALGGMESVKASLGLGAATAKLTAGTFGRTTIMTGLFVVLTGVANILASGLIIARLNFTTTPFAASVQLVQTKFLALVGASALVGLAIVAGAILFIIPGIIIGLLFAFTDFAIIIENHGIIGALRRSRDLGAGLRWPLFGRLFVYFIVLVLLSVIIQNAPLGATVTSLLFPPFGIVFLYELYIALRAPIQPAA